MLKRVLILSILILAQAGCSQSGENIGPYYIAPFPEEGRLLREADKRDSLQLEDLAIGTGPVAARGRRLTADIDVRYTDGTAIYRGTIISYPGFSRLVGNILRRSPNSAYFLVLNDRESRHSAIFLSAGYALFDGMISI